MRWKRSSFIASTPVVANADVSEVERARIQSQKKTTEGKKKGVDMFKHSWLTDRKTSFCDKTGK